MIRLKLFALLLVVRMRGSHAETRAWVNSEGNLEYCETEIFQGECGEGEVILMETARYGRMQFSRCISRDYGSLGCHADVLHLADKWCSGRRACQIPVPNSVFKAASDCPKDLTPYLEASYTCVKVDTADSQSCQKSKFILPSSPFTGYLANYITIETQKGSERCPWIIQSRPGQRINITLFDFARPSQLEHDYDTGYDVCSVYASISQTNAGTEQTAHRVCGGKPGPRKKVVFSTLSNRVEITITGSSFPDKSEYFLLKYEVLGCETLDDIPYMEKQIEDEHTVIYFCPTTGESWRLKCIHNQWQGEVGNCTEMFPVAVTTVAPSIPELVLKTLHLSFKHSLLVVILIAVAIGILIVICGVCCVVSSKKRKRRPRQSMQRPVQAVQPTSKQTPKINEYKKLAENGDIKLKCDTEKLPPPPPELLAKDGGHFVKGHGGSNTYECLTAKMPSPPPSPTAPPVSPRTDSTSTSTLSTLVSYPSNKRPTNAHSHASPYMHGVHTMPVKSRLGSGSSNPRSPHSAGYVNNRNSFEFPPPPPEVLRNAAYPQAVSNSAPNTMHKPLIELPDHDIIRYRIIDPRQDPFKKYGTLSNRPVADKGPDSKGRTDAHSAMDADSQDNTSVPYEYGYHLKTGKKFKIYQSPNATHRSPIVQPREERNRKMQSVASSSPASSKKSGNAKEQHTKTGTM